MANVTTCVVALNVNWWLSLFHFLSNKKEFKWNDAKWMVDPLDFHYVKFLMNHRPIYTHVASFKILTHTWIDYVDILLPKPCQIEFFFDECTSTSRIKLKVFSSRANYSKCFVHTLSHIIHILIKCVYP